jgi:predicted CoA-binding protein
VTDWKSLLLEDDAEVRALLARSHRLAILGIRSERAADRPAHYVARFLADAGYDVIPVPVYEPEVTTILGRPVYRRLVDVPPPIDLVVVFRRSEDIPPHLDDILAARPAAVWFQSGIRNDEAARRLAEAGISVVQDRCTKVEHRFIER